MAQIREKSWRFVVERDYLPAQFTSADSLTATEDALSASSARAARSVVEVRGGGGGLRPSALIGGEFRPDRETQLGIVIGHTGELSVGAVRSCPSLLSGSTLVAGLAVEFARAAMEGVTSARGASQLRAGTLRVDRGAYDEVDSSPVAFRLAARILVAVLSAAAEDREPDEEELRRLTHDG